MRRFSRFIATTLIAMLLATVLAPSFAWEASAARAAHGHDVLDLGDAGVLADVADRPAGQDSRHSPSTHEYHDSPGHLLAHLAALSCDASGCPVYDAVGVEVPERPQSAVTVSSRRLDRPPLASRLA